VAEILPDVASVLVLKGHTDTPRSVSFSPDGKKVVTTGDTTVRIWDVESGKELKQISGRFFCATFSPDGKKIATAWYSDNCIWDVESGKILRKLEGWDNSVTSSIAFSLDGKKIAMADLDDGDAVRIWDVESGKKLNGLVGNTGRAITVAFSPDGKKIATGGDRHPRIWDVESGKELQKLIGDRDIGQVRSVAFSPDGKRIVTSGYGTRIWDAESGKELQKLDIEEELYSFDITFPAFFLPDGKSIICGGSKSTRLGEMWTARIYDIESGKKLKELERRDEYDGVGHGVFTPYRNGVLHGAFSPDGKKVALGYRDKTVVIWTLE
jgi:WD40 repeat protein